MRDGGSRRLDIHDRGSKGRVRGNEFGVRGSDNFVVGYKRVHNRFFVGDGGGKVVHAVAKHLYEGS